MMSSRERPIKVDQERDSVTFTLDNGETITITHLGDALKAEGSNGLIISARDESIILSTFNALLA